MRGLAVLTLSQDDLEFRASISLLKHVIAKMRSLSVFVHIGIAAVSVRGKVDESKFEESDIIFRDVAIIGGGGSGAHAAVLLKQDHGKSVVVIEKQDRLV